MESLAQEKKKKIEKEREIEEEIGSYLGVFNALSFFLLFIYANNHRKTW